MRGADWQTSCCTRLVGTLTAFGILRGSFLAWSAERIRGLRPTEPGGELRHLALVKCSDSIEAEAECLAVFAHLHEQVASEGANSVGDRGVAADEDNEVVMCVCVEQTGELPVARGQYKAL
jgi:hypothetical protein